MKQRDYKDSLDTRGTKEYNSTKFDSYYNKLESLQINKDKILNDFVIVKISKAKMNKSSDEFLSSFSSIFKKDKAFYQKNLLSINVFPSTEALVLFKNVGGVDLVKKIEDDCGQNTEFIVKKVNEICESDVCSILNLLLKAVIKYENKDKPFINSTYKYVQFISFEKSNGDDYANFKAFIPRFVTSVSRDGEVEHYLQYEVRNFKKSSLLTDYEKNKKKNYERYSFVSSDFICDYDDELSSDSYVQAAMYSNKRAGHKEIVLYASDKEMFGAIKKMVSSKSVMFHDVVYKLFKYFGDYIVFEFKVIPRDNYVLKSEKDSKSKEVNARYLTCFKKQFEGKKLLIVMNSIRNNEFQDIVKEIIESELEIDVDLEFSDDYKPGFDYVVNVTYNPELYNKHGIKDPYLEHDLIIPKKNYIMESDEEIEKVEIRSKLKGMLLSLLVEEDIINKRSTLLPIAQYGTNFSFVLYRNNEYLYHLKLFKNGRIELYVINPKQSERIKGLGLSSSKETKLIKTFLDKRFLNEKRAGKLIDYNLVKNYNNELYMIRGEFDFFKPTENLYVLRRSYLKPISSPMLYKDLVLDVDELHTRTLENNSYYPKASVSSGEKSLGKKTLSVRGRDYKDFMLYSYMDIKIFGDEYITGYKDQNLKSNLDKSLVSRRLIGKDPYSLIDAFTNELLFEYRSLNNRFGSRPLAYKYLTVFKNIIENVRYDVKSDVN